MTGYVRTYTYKLDQRVNAGKLRALDALYEECQRVRPLFNRAIHALWQTSGTLPNALNYNQLPSPVSTSLPTNTQTAMLAQLIGTHKSWASNVKNRFALTIARVPDAAYVRFLISNRLLASEATESEKQAAVATLKHQLNWINRAGHWQLPFEKQQAYLTEAKENVLKKGKSVSTLDHLSVQASRISRKWFNSYLKRFKRPSVTELPLPLTQLTGMFDAPVKPKRSKSQTFSHWLRCSTLQAGQRIELPFLANPFANGKVPDAKEVAKSMTLHRKQGTYYLHRYGKFDTLDNEFGHVMSIDLGMNNLIATSDGDLEGVGYLKQLRKYDHQLQQIMKGLQQAGIQRYGACKRYRQKVAQIRGYIQTTIDTAMKRIMQRRQPRIIIVESLSFKHANLSRRMNRLLHFFGKGAFDAALIKYEEEYGIQVEKMPAAYTSQACQSCSFVSPKNRNGNIFQCKVCGKKAHADVNAAKNLMKRFHQCNVQPALTRLPYTQWWPVLFGQHVQTINRLPLSNTRVIGYARLAVSAINGDKVALTKQLINQVNVEYGKHLFKAFEHEQQPKPTGFSEYPRLFLSKGHGH